MQSMTKDDLRKLADESLKKLDIEIVDNIVNMIYHQVIHMSSHDEGTHLKWDVKTGYLFGGEHHIGPRHIVKACVRLQALFPDSVITNNGESKIEVDWT